MRRLTIANATRQPSGGRNSTRTGSEGGRYLQVRTCQTVAENVEGRERLTVMSVSMGSGVGLSKVTPRNEKLLSALGKDRKLFRWVTTGSRPGQWRLAAFRDAP